MSNRKKLTINIKITKTNSFLAIGLYCVISLCVLAYGFFNTAIDPNRGMFICIFGMVVFSLTEYVTHRFLYHSGKDYKNEKYWQYKIHGVHQIFPGDLKLLAMPIFLALFISGVLFSGIYLLWGDPTYFFWSGFMLGYAIYLFIHYMVHARKPPRNFLKYLWTHHALHHYVFEDKAFGVSSPLWDIIFGTMQPQRKKGLKSKVCQTKVRERNQ